MSKRADRRWFLKLLPQTVVGAAAIAAVPTILDAEIVPEPSQLTVSKGLSEEEMIAIANASAICFGLRPRGGTNSY